jgi:hypothetical protein
MNIVDYKEKFRDYSPVGEGWKSLVLKLIDDIITLDPEIEVMQIKEKWGGLRFYVGYASDEVFNLIDRAEEESFTICEHCGTKKGVKTRKTGWWITTSCLKCFRQLCKGKI